MDHSIFQEVLCKGVSMKALFRPANTIVLLLLILSSMMKVSLATANESNLTESDHCTATGKTVQVARSNYASSCNLPRIDCDYAGTEWICASYRIDSNSTVTNAPLYLSESTTQVSRATAASNSCIDTDGDGWGWDGQASCRMGESVAIDVPRNDASSTAINVANSETSSHCSGSYNPTDITDMILVTGQSNVTGSKTSVAGTMDRYRRVTEFHYPDKPHPRVFAWTVDPTTNNGTGWQVAELTQSWHDSSPGVGGLARNNFAFHFAKKVVQKDCRVVGIIMVSEGGRGISHWDDQSIGWQEVNRQVNDAIAAVGRSKIDGILWHQGESDWIPDGTCYTGTTCRNNLPDYYAQKLYSRITDNNIPNPVGSNALIDRLRMQSWFNSQSPFIAGETIKAPVNVHLNKLNTDGDRYTACVAGSEASGLGIREDDPHKNHYSAAGLRELGKRYAAAYLDMVDD